MKLFNAFLFLIFLSCNSGGGGGGGGSSIKGINKTGTWVPNEPYATCWTDDTFSTVEAQSNISGLLDYQVVVIGNSATEIIEDSDCKVATTFNLVVEETQTTITNREVVATPSPCTLTYNVNNLINITSVTETHQTESLPDGQLTSVTNDSVFAMHAPSLEAGSSICFSYLTPQ